MLSARTAALYTGMGTASHQPAPVVTVQSRRCCSPPGPFPASGFHRCDERMPGLSPLPELQAGAQHTPGCRHPIIPRCLGVAVPTSSSLAVRRLHLDGAVHLQHTTGSGRSGQRHILTDAVHGAGWVLGMVCPWPRRAGCALGWSDVQSHLTQTRGGSRHPAAGPYGCGCDTRLARRCAHTCGCDTCALGQGVSTSPWLCLPTQPGATLPHFSPSFFPFFF